MPTRQTWAHGNNSWFIWHPWHEYVSLVRDWRRSKGIWCAPTTCKWYFSLSYVISRLTEMQVNLQQNFRRAPVVWWCAPAACNCYIWSCKARISLLKSSNDKWCVLFNFVCLRGKHRHMGMIHGSYHPLNMDVYLWRDLCKSVCLRGKHLLTISNLLYHPPAPSNRLHHLLVHVTRYQHPLAPSNHLHYPRRCACR